MKKRRPQSVALVKGDLLKVVKLPGIVEEAVAAFGRLDALVNNASEFLPHAGAGAATEEQWDVPIGTNLKAPFFLRPSGRTAPKEDLRQHRQHR